jgi:hypothetical protein
MLVQASLPRLVQRLLDLTSVINFLKKSRSSEVITAMQLKISFLCGKTPRQREIEATFPIGLNTY